MRALLQRHDKRSTMGSATIDFFFGRHPSPLLSTAQSTQSPLRGGKKKKKSIAYPKKLKKARVSKEMAAAAHWHPRGLAITSRGGSHCPPSRPRPGAGSNPRSLSRRPAARLYGGRQPRTSTSAAAVGRYGTAPRDIAQRRSCPSLVVSFLPTLLHCFLFFVFFF